MVSEFLTDLKARLHLLMPGPYRLARRFLTKSGRESAWLNDLTQQFIARHGLVISGGPFKGMVIEKNIADEIHQTAAKLIGSYESELHGFLETIIHTEYSKIINIGSADGYYAIGLALQKKGVPVYAFEMDPLPAKLCRMQIAANHVADQVSLLGACDLEQLSSLNLDRALIVCDCEGCEVHLLRPDVLPGLKSCDILVELHDVLDPSISPTLLPRFAGTHNISIVSSTDRDPSVYRALDFLSEQNRVSLIAESGRAGVMEWAYMTPKLPKAGN